MGFWGFGVLGNVHGCICLEATLMESRKLTDEEMEYWGKYFEEHFKKYFNEHGDEIVKSILKEMKENKDGSN